MVYFYLMCPVMQDFFLLSELCVNLGISVELIEIDKLFDLD